MQIIAYAIGFVYAFWLMFVVYSACINTGWSKLPLFPKVLLAPVGLVFMAMDVAFNLTAGSLLFLQLPTLTRWPPSWTLSVRLARLVKSDTTWRGKLASVIVRNLLLPFTANY